VLVEAELIEEAAIAEAADVLATALAVEDAAAADVAATLVEADLIEEAAMVRLPRQSPGALAIEDEAEEEAEGDRSRRRDQGCCCAGSHPGADCRQGHRR